MLACPHCGQATTFPFTAEFDSIDVGRVKENRYRGTPAGPISDRVPNQPLFSLFSKPRSEEQGIQVL
jgi:hypothetical protein